MASLSGQTIQSSYQGLLKLADSSTGITSSFQAVQDGLGNDTGVKIATNYLASPNNPGFLNLKADYYGVGFTNTGQAPVANTQNILLAYPFYDNGMYSYSAITYNIATATTIGDTVEVAFYTSQMVSGVGLAPHTQVLSAQTLTVNSTGIKTTTLSSNLSFSGYGAGVFFLVMKISNSGATPTVRITGMSGQFQTSNAAYLQQLGYTFNTGGTGLISPWKSGGATGIPYSGLSTFNSSFSTVDVSGVSTISPPPYGWALKTVF